MSQPPTPRSSWRPPSVWLKAVSSVTRDAGLGSLHATVLEVEQGWIVARFIRPEFGIFIAVYLDEEGRLGAARHRVDQVARELREGLQTALQTHQERK